MAKRVTDKIRAAQCPDCGKYMDKVRVLVTDQMSAGSVKNGDAGTGWVCSKCYKKQRKGVKHE